jgi:hypothetical protein
MANRQTTPDAIPIRLSTTCKVVKVESDIPRIMTRPLHLSYASPSLA